MPPENLFSCVAFSALLLVSAAASAQKVQTTSGKTSFMSIRKDEIGGTERYSYYVGDDGKTVYHGAYTFSGQEAIKHQQESDFAVNYNLSATIKGGKYVGAFSFIKGHGTAGSRGYYKGQFTADGKLTGKWNTYNDWKEISSELEFVNDFFISRVENKTATPPAQQELARQYAAGKIYDELTHDWDDAIDNIGEMEKNIRLLESVKSKIESQESKAVNSAMKDVKISAEFLTALGL